MVASGLGVSVLPTSALTSRYATRMVRVIPFSAPVPSRKVALAWRASFDRPAAIEVLADSLRTLKMPCLKVAKAA
jgi:LysR family hydrogen peroxide-inducible transcriptional activator